jgi:oligopeptide/dipeptide ABC transporter ATP-binding protein
VLESLRTAQQATGAAMVLITHDLGVVAGQADRVLVMYAGKPVEIGSVDDIYYNPRMPYTLGLLGSLPRLDADRAERLTPIQGAPPSLLSLPPGCPFMPRCPLAKEVCAEQEPELLITDNPLHSAACHYSALLSGKQADEVLAVSPEAYGAEIAGVTGEVSAAVVDLPNPNVEGAE